MTKKNKNTKAKDKENRITKAVKAAVLQFLKKNVGRSLNHKQIAAGSDLRGKISHPKLIEILDEMVEAGGLEASDRGKYQLVWKSRELVGRLEVTRDGYGFVVLEGDEKRDDIFIAPNRMERALNGDMVRIRIVKDGRRGQRSEGEVIEIIERASEVFIGTIDIVGKAVLFLPDDPKINHDFVVTVPQGMEVRNGDKVLLKLTDWEHHIPQGTLVKVLGQSGENETEMHAILFQFGFEVEFPPEVEEESEAISAKIGAAEIKKRRDMRAVTTFTIDPPDAKDFDDALSFQKLKNGNIEVGVHIADVSHFVQPGTALDAEAFNRATSVYLVDRTVPMLPERLSNNLCSLKPNEDRLTFSAIFEVDEAGNLIKEWFGRTVIHSDRRFAYEEAQEIMDKGGGDYFHELTELNRLAKIFQMERFLHGSINFEEDEVKFELDEKGKPIRVFRKVRKDAHKMIEDWMLMANKRVCFRVAKMRQGIPLPFVYRVHDTPDDEKLYTLQQFAATLGYELDLSDERRIAKSLNALMNQVEGKPEQGMLQTVAVRTMAKAIYTIDNIGHYGLGFEYYTHFTSPIRRYPDLMVHRLLGKYLEKHFEANPGQLDAAAKHCTNREKRASDAERASIKYKQVEFLEDKIGLQFEGIITGVTSWGLYVEILENRCEGMVGLHAMQDDYYEVDQEHYCVRGRMTGRKITLGDKVIVEVKGTSLRNRTIDFLFVEHLESAFHDTDKPMVAMKRNLRESSKGGRGGSRGGTKAFWTGKKSKAGKSSKGGTKSGRSGGKAKKSKKGKK